MPLHCDVDDGTAAGALDVPPTEPAPKAADEYGRSATATYGHADHREDFTFHGTMMDDPVFCGATVDALLKTHSDHLIDWLGRRWPTVCSQVCALTTCCLHLTFAMRNDRGAEQHVSLLHVLLAHRGGLYVMPSLSVISVMSAQSTVCVYAC